MDEPSERLRAFCSITFDNCFVVRDLKIIDGTGGPFVAMPSRKLTMHCPRCRCKNHLKAAYCNQCGFRFDDSTDLRGDAHRDESGRNKLYADIAHPINSACREMIQEHVVRAFEEELERSRQPGYISTYDDFGEDRDGDFLPDGPHYSKKEPDQKQPETESRENTDDFGAGVFE